MTATEALWLGLLIAFVGVLIDSTLLMVSGIGVMLAACFLDDRESRR